MTKNALSDVHDHLVARLEELSDETVDAEKLETIVTRARASCEVAREIGSLGRLALDAIKTVHADYGNETTAQLPAMLTYRKTSPQ